MVRGGSDGEENEVMVKGVCGSGVQDQRVFCCVVCGAGSVRGLGGVGGRAVVLGGHMEPDVSR